MTFRRTILIVLLIVLSMLLIYNSYIAPLFVRSYSQMGMGMHGGMRTYYNVNSFIDFRIILLFAIVIASIFLYDILSPSGIANRCNHCGHSLDNDRWNICPQCGSGINKRKGER